MVELSHIQETSSILIHSLWGAKAAEKKLAEASAWLSGRQWFLVCYTFWILPVPSGKLT